MDCKNTVIMEQKAILLRYIGNGATPCQCFFWFPTIVMSEMCSMAWTEILFVGQDALTPHRADDALSNETTPSLDGARHD